MKFFLNCHFSPLLLQFLNAGLRLMSLGAKLLLTIYMGRYLGLSEMGTYGLVAACVAIAIPFLGVRLNYVTSRDIVELPPIQLAHKMRDEAAFYSLNYFLVTFISVIFLFFYSEQKENLTIFWFVLILSFTESIGAFTSGNLVSLKRPLLSSILFFVRSALWVFPVVCIGLICPQFRTAEFVLICWLVGVFISLILTAIVWRDLPWSAVSALPIDWAWICRSIKICFPIWLGSVGAATAGNLDRFVVEHFLGRDFVGIASFYASFVGAMIGLLQNGVMSFSYPRLVSHFKKNEAEKFWEEARKMTLQASLSTAIMAIVVGGGVPFLGSILGRPEFSQYASTLWLMLFAVWIKSSAEGLYYVLYARHQDRPIWAGNLMLLMISLLTNVAFVWEFGFIGIGMSAVVSAVFICAWRIYWVCKFKPRLEAV